MKKKWSPFKAVMAGIIGIVFLVGMVGCANSG
jgi:hypothetical protein